MQIVPAILTNNERDFVRQIERLLPHFSLIQIDVQDGIYVPSTTLSLPSIYKCLAKLNKSNPTKMSEAHFDFHLMLSEYSEAPKVLLDILSITNIRYIFVHKNITSGIDDFQGLCPTLNPEDSKLLQKKSVFLQKDMFSYQAIQIMTINPGPQGQQFCIENLEKVSGLRKNGFKGEILVDGAINEDSMQKILEMEKSYWPDTFCVGSYLSKSSPTDLPLRIDRLKNMILSK